MDANEDRSIVEAKSKWAMSFVKGVVVPERDMMQATKLLDISSKFDRGKMDKCQWLHDELENNESCYLGTIMGQILKADSGMKKICSLDWFKLPRHDEDRANILMETIAEGREPLYLQELGRYFDLFDEDQMVDGNLLDPASQREDLYEVSCNMS